MDEYAIGVDLGGTQTKLVLVNLKGEVVLRQSTPTHRDDSSPKPVVNALIQVVTGFIDLCTKSGYKPMGIGFALPFYHTGPEWTLLQSNNLPSLEGYSLYPELQAAFGERIAALNDVCCAGIAEHLFGKGQGVERMLLMAIGTGISVSFISQEQGLVHFTWDAAGDTGQIIVDPLDARACPCGGHGCLEAYASAPAIRGEALRMLQTAPKESLLLQMYSANHDISAQDVSVAAAQGDGLALDLLAKTGRYIGVALASYLHIFAPALMLLGGGVSQAGELILEPARKEVERLGSPWYKDRLVAIDTAALGPEAGAIGAASLILFPGKYYREN